MTSARISETRQQHYPDGFGIASHAGEGQYYFVARPKARTELASYFIDAATLDAVTAVVAVAQRNGDPVRAIPESAKNPVQRGFLYQRRGRRLDCNALNAALRVVLFGHVVRNHDLRAAFARFTDNNNAGRRRVQASLHHECEQSTVGYTRPTEAMRRALARRLSEQVRTGYPPQGDCP